MEKLYSSKALLKKVPHPWIRPDPRSNSWNRDRSTAQTTGSLSVAAVRAAEFSLKSLETPFMMQ